MELQKRRKYSKEFIEDVINMIKTGNKPVSVIAKDLGIQESILYRWHRKYSGKENPSIIEVQEQDAELRTLRKKLADISEERDILKKAISIFSRQEN